MNHSCEPGAESISPGLQTDQEANGDRGAAHRGYMVPARLRMALEMERGVCESVCVYARMNLRYAETK